MNNENYDKFQSAIQTLLEKLEAEFYNNSIYYYDGWNDKNNTAEQQEFCHAQMRELEKQHAKDIKAVQAFCDKYASVLLNN